MKFTKAGQQYIRELDSRVQRAKLSLRRDSFSNGQEEQMLAGYIPELTSAANPVCGQVRSQLSTAPSLLRLLDGGAFRSLRRIRLRHSRARIQQCISGAERVSR